MVKLYEAGVLLRTHVEEYEEALGHFRFALQDHVLEEHGSGALKAVVLRAPGTMCQSVTLLFTGHPLAERIAVTGDLCPEGPYNAGVVSAGRYGIEWFAQRPVSPWYLASKFLHTRFVTSKAYSDLTSEALDLLDEGRVDWVGWSPEDGEDPPSIADLEFSVLDKHKVEKFEAIDELLFRLERGDELSEEGFYNFWVETFGTSPESQGCTYDPEDHALLVAIQECFSRLWLSRKATVSA
jgi:hypothetical protein